MKVLVINPGGTSTKISVFQLFFFLIEQLIEEHTEPNLQSNLENTNIEIQAVCDYLENNYA
ncbi:hypothetical protein ACTPD5_22330, partial [Clostridioides difficile]